MNTILGLTDDFLPNPLIVTLIPRPDLLAGSSLRSTSIGFVILPWLTVSVSALLNVLGSSSGLPVFTVIWVWDCPLRAVIFCLKSNPFPSRWVSFVCVCNLLVDNPSFVNLKSLEVSQDGFPPLPLPTVPIRLVIWPLYDTRPRPLSWGLCPRPAPSFFRNGFFLLLRIISSKETSYADILARILRQTGDYWK